MTDLNLTFISTRTSKQQNHQDTKWFKAKSLHAINNSLILKSTEIRSVQKFHSSSKFIHAQHSKHRNVTSPEWKKKNDVYWMWGVDSRNETKHNPKSKEEKKNKTFIKERKRVYVGDIIRKWFLMMKNRRYTQRKKWVMQKSCIFFCFNGWEDTYVDKQTVRYRGRGGKKRQTKDPWPYDWRN